MSQKNVRIAVVLSGCGVQDGSEIHEAVSVLVHLSRHGASVRCFAPDKEQAVAFNHFTGEVEPRRQRNMLHESARIARGGASESPGSEPLADLDAAEYDAVIFPGGFGAARNLCTFAVDGAACDIERDVERVIRTFHAAGKPIGMCCIAPVLAAKVLGKVNGCTLTLGAEGDAPKAVRELGATHKVCGARDVCVDEANRLITTPAYMLDAPLFDIYTGIGKMVDEVLARVGSGSPVAGRA